MKATGRSSTGNGTEDVILEGTEEQQQRQNNNNNNNNNMVWR